MNNLEQLFIRACKAKEPRKRLNSVYRRFYLVDEDTSYGIGRILLQICEKYNLGTLSHVVNSFMSTNHPTLSEKLMWCFVHIIRFTDGDTLMKLGYTIPRKFRQ